MNETTAESVSRFLRWAESRIADEVESNEKFEAKAGTRDIVIKYDGLALCKTSYSMIELRSSKISKEMKRGGEAISKCVKQFNISASTYYSWKRSLAI
jgi:hypothetical protein